MDKSYKHDRCLLKRQNIYRKKISLNSRHIEEYCIAEGEWFAPFSIKCYYVNHFDKFEPLQKAIPNSQHNEASRFRFFSLENFSSFNGYKKHSPKNANAHTQRRRRERKSKNRVEKMELNYNIFFSHFY